VIEASHYERAPGDRVLCRLCPHDCDIAPGGEGLCAVRRNVGGILYAASYEELTRLGPEPVERLPFYHWRPGGRALAAGAAGESFPPGLGPPARAAGEDEAVEEEEPAPSRYFAAHEIVDMAAGRSIPAIAFFGGEPFMWFEQMREIAAVAHAEGLATLLVTNGYAHDAPAREMAPLLDAVNVALLGPAAVYERLARARREAVFATIDVLRAAGAHLEATYVVVPGVNDDPRSVDEMAEIVLRRMGGAPLHVAAAAPAGPGEGAIETTLGRLEVSAGAPVAALIEIGERLRGRLPHVYLSNVYSAEANNTLCRSCRAVLVDRLGPRIAVPGLRPDGACRKCGTDNLFRLGPAAGEPRP
jgi:pyruvate formate lyase activating enzyme